MKRDRFTLALVLGAGFAVCVGLCVLLAFEHVRAFRAETKRHEVLHLSNGALGAGVWGVWTGHSFAYGIETGPHSVALIDAGSDAQATALIEQLASRSLSPADVHTIILTHGHDEVQAGLAHFANATIWVGPDDWMLARRDVLPKPVIAKLQAKAMRTERLPKLAMQPLWPGQTLHLGTHEAQLVAIPGHTWGSFAVVIDDIVFVGDSIAGPRQTGHDAGNSTESPPQIFGRTMSVSPKHNAMALQRLAGLHVSLVATTHAGVLSRRDVNIPESNAALF